MNWFRSTRDSINQDSYSESHGKGTKSKMVYDFDPVGLERAANSSRELKENPLALQILSQRDKELQNRKVELINDQKAYELKIEQAKLEGIKQQHEYAIEVLKEEARTHKSKAEYEDFLARERKKDSLKIQNASNSELLKLQEDSIKKQEELRKKTIDYELEKKNKYDEQFSEKFWRNKAIYEKETKDISMAQLQQLHKSNTDMKIALLDAREKIMSKYISKLNLDSLTFQQICIGIGTFILSTYGVYRGIRTTNNVLSNKFIPPEIIRTIKINTHHSFENKELGKDLFEKEGLFYNENTYKSLINLIDSTKNLKANNGFMRNFLFYGPPGNGKTIFANKLSEYSGLKYAMLSGGDLLPMKEKSVDELNKVFDWSYKKDGLILFLDEADAFLKKRDKVIIGENMRSALNTFLYRSSFPSKSLMMIISTNKPEQLDRAVTDRMDGIIEFPFPDRATRIKVLQKYFDVEKSQIKLDDMTYEKFIDTLAGVTEGLSLRQISKLCVSYEAAALSRVDRILDKNTMVQMANDLTHQNMLKEKWSNIEGLPLIK